MRGLLQDRLLIAAALSLIWGVWLNHRHPWPADDPLIGVSTGARPGLMLAMAWCWKTMLFTTPFLALYAVLSTGFIFAYRRKKEETGTLPPFPDPRQRTRLEIVVGEVHHERKPGPAPRPRWLTIPDRGLFTGTIIFGAIGSSKTSGCMDPFAEQILSYKKSDENLRPGGLVLEVKGNFCERVAEILERHGRGGDYCEVSIRGKYRYNPLHHTDASDAAFALAFGIVSAITNIYGKGKEPFWHMAGTNLVKFVIIAHKILFDYVTLFDVYATALQPARIDQMLTAAEEAFRRISLLVDGDEYLQHPELAEVGFEWDEESGQFRAQWTPERQTKIRALGLELEIETEDGAAAPDPYKYGQLEALALWYRHDWMSIEHRLRTSIVEGVSVFLSMFHDDPHVKWTFCPTKQEYLSGGDALPPFTELIEVGKVVAINLPVVFNPGLARALGTMMKMDFQRAVLSRIPRLSRSREQEHRAVLFLCDEYQSFATVGENDPSGDEKFFALSREARCIPIVATQSISALRSVIPGESWRTLLASFRTKIFLTITDEFTAKVASDMCGREERLKESYSLSESGSNARMSLLTGRAAAKTANLSTSKTYTAQMLPVFETKIFAELPNAMAVVLAYDGRRPLPPMYCYLKPAYLPRELSWFDAQRQGLL